MFAEIEIWTDGDWHLAARLEAVGEPERGYFGATYLEYLDDYALSHLGATGGRALSCRYPPSLELWRESQWPAFILDLLPMGAARRSILERAGLSEGRQQDWPLLLQAQHAPGNLRIRPTEPREPAAHPGFTRDDIVVRGANFIEYAFTRGAPIGGSSGAQGEAPKFLVVEDRAGQWHAEGAIPPEDVQTHWLVKFPRGRHQTDSQILEEEARYMDLARDFGLRANERLTFIEDCLFIPRFDCAGTHRYGLETTASLLGISDFGVRPSLQDSATALAQHCTNPEKELEEFLCRDIFNLAVGNTDNHVRNTSVLKHQDGKVVLSPLYDVAPMMLDRSGIPRACRWGPREAPGAVIDWAGVVHDLTTLGASADGLRHAVEKCATNLAALPKGMMDRGVGDDLVRRLQPGIAELRKRLERAHS